jgi:hypothetical protein
MWWARSGSRRNPRNCACQQCEETGHLVATKQRGVKRFLGTQHQAAHFTTCQHSELMVTTQRVPEHVLAAMAKVPSGTAGYVDGGKRARARARDKAKRAARRRGAPSQPAASARDGPSTHLGR